VRISLPVVPIAVVLLSLAAAPAAQAQALAPRTLTRDVDTVVIPGRAIGARVRGAPINRLRVYVSRGGFPVPIMYQIDERNAAGTYCYDQGPSDKRVRDEDRGQFDDNDELVLLVRDAGERMSPARYSMVPGHTAVQELELKDPVTGGLAWVYVFRFDGAVVPGRVGSPLVALTCRVHDDEESTWTWQGEKFIFDNDRSRKNAVRATFASFFDGTPARRGPNVLDSTIVRAVVSFMWVEVVRQSNDIKVELGAWLAGPIRVIAQNVLQVYLALGMWASAPDSYIILWPNKVSMPTNASCPVNLDESGESSYTLCMDLSKEAKGWKFYNLHNPEPVDIDGRTSAAERGLNQTWPEWNCMMGPNGAIITKFVIPPAMRRPTNRLVYIDDEYHRRAEDVEGIEFEPGAFGTNGYYVDMRGLAKGIYPGDYVAWYAGAPFAVGDEQKFLNEWDAPVEVKATAPN
jgi:hypothetical protein